MSMMCARWVSRSTTAFASRGSGNTLVHSPNGQVGGDDQAAAFVAFGEDLEDELGGAVGQGQVAELVEDDELGAGVAADDAGELAAALGFLEFVREAARVVKRTRRPCWQAQTARAVASVGLAGAASRR